MRKNVLKYDDVMNRQRHAIYGDRRRVLDGEDVSPQLRKTSERVVRDVVTEHTAGFEEDWDLEQMLTELQTLYPVSISLDELEDDLPDQEGMIDLFVEDVEKAYDRREEEIGEERMRELERQVLLTVLDRKWREHLYEMDYLRDGIGLRAMAQRDPLTEYQREGGDMFNAMMGAFMEEVIGYLFHLEVPKADDSEPQEERVEADGEGEPNEDSKALAKGLEQKEPENLQYSAPDESGEATKSGASAKAAKKPGRNQPCYCGSGKKYKVCHGAKR